MIGNRAGPSAVLVLAAACAFFFLVYLYRDSTRHGDTVKTTTLSCPPPQVSLTCPECAVPACNCNCGGGGGSSPSNSPAPSSYATPPNHGSSQFDSGLAPPCKHDCGVNGQCFLGKCFCYPGYDGDSCQTKSHSIPNCAPRTDACYEHKTNGRMVVPMSRWDMANKQESDLWAGSGGSNDRSGDHIAGFKNYKDVPSDLGDIIEIGCGPYTQTRAMLGTRPDIKVKSLTLEDPSVVDYMKRSSGCTYKNGKLKKWGSDHDGGPVHDFPMVFINAGGEQLTHLHMYDTLYVANVVEHVWNGYDLWQNIYNVIKPGGLIIFNDMYYNGIPTDYWHDIDSIFHPVRPFKAVLDHFLSKFEQISKYENELPGVVDGSIWHKQGYYFVGRKPLKWKE